MPEHLTSETTPKLGLLISMVLACCWIRASPPPVVWFEVLEPETNPSWDPSREQRADSGGGGGPLNLPFGQMTDTEPFF